jgi:hypothetical protein
MGKGIEVLLYLSVMLRYVYQARTSVVYGKAASSHFSGVSPDCIAVGVYGSPVVPGISCGLGY